MKILKRILFVFIIMIFVSMVNVDAAGVSVKSIRLIDHTGNATELSEAIPNGLNIKFDLSFSNVGDTAKYEVVLNNPTNKEYEINTDKQFSGSNYISYSYELKDKTNRIKANSEVVLYITVKYENAVPVDKLVDGKYVENNDMGINLLNEDNPDTFNNFLFIILMIVLMGVATLVFKYTKDKGLYIIVLSLMLVPITVFALEKLKLTVSTKITIEESKYKIYYSIGSVIKKSELNDNEYVYDNCRLIKIQQANDSYEDYYRCSSIYRIDDYYKPGERVSIKVTTDSVINTDYCGTNEEDHLYYCTSNALKSYAYTDLLYRCGGLPVHVSDCNETLDNLEFNSVGFNEWNQYGYIRIVAPNEFTMPNHDVYFGLYYYK